MKYLLKKIAAWRIIADTNMDSVYVVDRHGNTTLFPDRRSAYAHVAREFRKESDLRNLQTGQIYDLPMFDGTVKRIQVQQNTPEYLQGIDVSTGKSVSIPHLQPGAAPKQIPQNNTTYPQIPPGQATAAHVLLGKNDIRTAGDIGREPYYCKHDGGYLYRKEPHTPEKYCAQCGMVYAASRKEAASGVNLCKKCLRKKRFLAWKNRHRIVRAFEVISAPADAQPPLEKNPGEEPIEKPTIENLPRKVNPERKRRLTPHEIIDEAETLIRNALVRGIKIGSLDLLEHMLGYYDNEPKDLLEGISLAWKKVQYEESALATNKPPAGDNAVDIPDVTPDSGGILQTEKLL